MINTEKFLKKIKGANRLFKVKETLVSKGYTIITDNTGEHYPLYYCVDKCVISLVMDISISFDRISYQAIKESQPNAPKCWEYNDDAQEIHFKYHLSDSPMNIPVAVVDDKSYHTFKRITSDGYPYTDGEYAEFNKRCDFIVPDEAKLIAINYVNETAVNKELQDWADSLPILG